MSSALPEREARSCQSESRFWLARPRPDHALNGDPILALAPLLSAAEQDRAARLRFTDDRWSYCTAHAGLRVLLAAALCVEPLDIAFTLAPNGKPALDPAWHGKAASEALHFNISHTRGMVAVAIAPVPVGIDVEPVRHLADMRALVTTHMAPEALQAYDSTLEEAARIELFFRYWTLGEAFIKATGLGLDQGLDTFAFTAEGEPRLTRVTPGWGTPARWNLGLARSTPERIPA